MTPPFDILFEDEHCLVVNKPAGLSTQAPRAIDSLEMKVRAWLQSQVDADMAFWQADPSGQAPAVYLGLPHRLDRPVTGAIVLAKTKKGARKISHQFEQRQVQKLYWAAVEGFVEPAAGTWIDWMRKVPDVAQAEIVPHDHAAAQRAVLHYRTLGNTPHGSWLEIELETGRMHQIRLQAASHGFPILGDLQYGSRIRFGPQCEDARMQAIALHAQFLSFIQPITQIRIKITAPVGKVWQELGIENSAQPAFDKSATQED